MDSFLLNKVAGAVLGTLLFAFGLGFVSELIYEPKPAGNAGYALPEPAPQAAGGGEAAAPKAAAPIAIRLASADPKKGEASTKACQACHNFAEGAGAKIGPVLYDVVERAKASTSGFEYSAALKEKGGAWTYDDLDHFLENPKAYAKGTKMAYQGLASPDDRANVITYLRSLSKEPKALPAAEKKDESKAEKPADANAGGDKKPADAKAAESKPAEAKTEGDKRTEDTKPADKTREGKPAEVKSEGDKPDDAKPAEKPAE